MTILVAYASKHGSTEGIAKAIADRLVERGKEVDLRRVDGATDLASPEAVVLGSAVYVGSWMTEALEFAMAYRDTLATIPVWLFSSGPLGTQVEDEDEQPKQLQALRDAFAPRDHRMFYGALDPDELGFGERLMVKAIKAPIGDFRDWDAIGAYADEMADALDQAP